MSFWSNKKRERQLCANLQSSVALHRDGFQMLEMPKEALFLAGKAYLNYKKSRGAQKSPLPDFYIGAQTAVLGMDLITRDKGRYRTYFPTVRIICPE